MKIFSRRLFVQVSLFCIVLAGLMVIQSPFELHRNGTKEQEVQSEASVLLQETQNSDRTSSETVNVLAAEEVGQEIAQKNKPISQESAPYPTTKAIDSETLSQEEHYEGVRTLLRVNNTEYTVFSKEDSTVYDVMERARKSHGLHFAGTHYPGLGFFVDEVEGVKQSVRNKMFWIYYVNGNTATVGVSQYVVKENDVIEWKYEAAK